MSWMLRDPSFLANQYEDPTVANARAYGLLYGMNDPRAGVGSFSRRLAGSQQGGTMGGVPGAFQSAYDEAKKANLDRYNSIDKSYEGIEGRAREAVAGANKSTIDDVNRVWDENEVKITAPFDKSLGPNQASVVAALQTGNARERSAALSRAYDQMLQTKLLPEQYAKDRLMFQERRDDTYPNPNRMDNLMQQGGEADGGGPGPMPYVVPGVPGPGFPVANIGYAPRLNKGPSLGFLRNQKNKWGTPAARPLGPKPPTGNPSSFQGPQIPLNFSLPKFGGRAEL